MGAGIPMAPGDIAFKSNFATLDSATGVVLRRRADRRFEDLGPQLCAALDGALHSTDLSNWCRALFWDMNIGDAGPCAQFTDCLKLVFAQALCRELYTLRNSLRACSCAMPAVNSQAKRCAAKQLRHVSVNRWLTAGALLPAKACCAHLSGASGQLLFSQRPCRAVGRVSGFQGRSCGQGCACPASRSTR